MEIYTETIDITITIRQKNGPIQSVVLPKTDRT